MPMTKVIYKSSFLNINYVLWIRRFNTLSSCKRLSKQLNFCYVCFDMRNYVVSEEEFTEI